MENYYEFDQKIDFREKKINFDKKKQIFDKNCRF